MSIACYRRSDSSAWVKNGPGGKKNEGLYERLEQAKVDKIQAADLEIPCFAINRPVKKYQRLV